MSVPAYVAIGLFAFGVLLGLIFGPSTERVESARMEGWVDGYNAAKAERRP